VTSIAHFKKPSAQVTDYMEIMPFEKP